MGKILDAIRGDDFIDEDTGLYVNVQGVTQSRFPQVTRLKQRIGATAMCVMSPGSVDMYPQDQSNISTDGHFVGAICVAAGLMTVSVLISRTGMLDGVFDALAHWTEGLFRKIQFNYPTPK